MASSKYSGATALTALLVMIKNKFDSKADKEDAERNAIVGVQQNGADIPIDEDTRKVNIITPTKIGDLEDDEDYVAASATKLATARTIRTNLASTSTASFDGTGNITPGVTGTLPIANGGTGNTTGLAASATKLATARTIRTNLASTSTASFDGTGNITPGVTGILPKANGGTGSSNFLTLVYPVGAIYMSVNSTSPASLFGGTWTQLKDRFLLAAGSSYSAGATGGEATHTLTTSEMPSHSHKTYVEYSAGSLSLEQWDSCICNGSWDQVWESGGRSGFSSVTIALKTGSGSAHNNMPPYLAVYVWKRTA